VINGFNREAWWIEGDLSLPTQQIKQVLEPVIGWRGIALSYIQPGNPQQNAYIE